MLSPENKWPSIVFYKGQNKLTGAESKLLIIKDDSLPKEIEEVNELLLERDLMCEYVLLSDRYSYQSQLQYCDPDIILIYSDNSFVTVEELLLTINHFSIPIPILVISSEKEKASWADWYYNGVTDIILQTELEKLPFASLRSLMNRRYVKQFLQRNSFSFENEKRLKILYGISAFHHLSYEDQINEVLRLATINLQLETGLVGVVTEEEYKIMYQFSSVEVSFRKGMVCPFDQTICQLTYQANDVIAIAFMGETEYANSQAYKALEIETYIGVPLYVNGERYGTLNFSQKVPRNEEFSQADKEWVKLLGRWVGGILEKQQMEQALRESEDRHRFIVEHQSEMICRFLPDTTLVFVNKAYCQFFKTTKEQLIGKKFIEFVPKSNQSIIYRNIEKVKSIQSSALYEHQVYNPDGSISWQQWIDHPIFNEEGQLSEILSVGRDISTMKKIEHENILYMMRGENRERTRIAGDIHDGLAQTLTAANLMLNSLKNHIETLQPRQQEIYHNIQGLVQQAMKDCRNISHTLMPKGLEDFGLISALEQFTNTMARTGDISFQVETNFPRKTRFDRDAEINIYRMIQEAISNIMKHSKATHAHISLHLTNNMLHIEVKDNGVGFDPSVELLKEGIGIQSIKQRVHSLQGKHRLESNPNQGTTLYWDIPHIKIEPLE